MVALMEIAQSRIGDDSFEEHDAVSFEECSCSIHESCCCDCFFISQGLGVGQAGVAVDSGV